MTGSNVRVGVGTRILYDGDPFEVVDMRPTTAGNELALRAMTGRRDPDLRKRLSYVFGDLEFFRADFAA